MKPILIWDMNSMLSVIGKQVIRRLALIDSSPLPIMMNIKAIRLIVITKIQLLLLNVHIPQCKASEKMALSQ